MTKYYCEICGQAFTTPTGATAKKHVEGKKHQQALKVEIKPNLEHEIILFNAINKINNPSYSNILKFFSSFGIKTEVTLKTILKKLRDKDIIYKGNTDPDYEKILKFIISSENFTYPMTFSIQEALEKFKFLNFKYASELIQYFYELSQKYPELLTLSPTKIGESPDLITFKQIFINQLKFYPNKNWDI
jgi:hypothetical protein